MSAKGTLDIQVLSRILKHPEEIPELLELGIDAHHFADSTLAEVLAFILDVRAKTGKIPSPITVEARTGFLAGEAPETLSYYCNLMIERAVFYVVRDGKNDAHEFLAKGKTQKALDRIGETVRWAIKEQVRAQKIYNIESVEPRITRYEDLSVMSGVDGIPFPWTDFTNETYGWHKNDFGLITARTGIGKTWLSLLCANAAWTTENRVLFVTMEMSAEDIHQRHDAMCSEISFDRFRKGKLTPKEESKWRRTMTAIESLGGFHVIGYDMAGTTQQIQAAIELTEPDIVFIDGLYLVRPSSASPRMSKWERYGEVADEVKRFISTYNIPIVGSLQLNRDQKKNTKEADTSNIYGSDVFGQHSSIALALIQTREHLTKGLMQVSVIKSRNGVPMVGVVDWDLERMSFDLVHFELGVTSPTPPKVGPTPKVMW